MNKNIIFAFILLATLSVINAIPHQLNKRTTEFGACPVEPPAPAFDSVILSPDPIVIGKNVDVDFTATLGKNVADNIKNMQLAIAFLDINQDPVAEPYVVVYCKEIAKNTKCSDIKEGTKINEKATVLVPVSKDKMQSIAVSINDIESGDFEICSTSTSKLGSKNTASTASTYFSI